MCILIDKALKNVDICYVYMDILCIFIGSGAEIYNIILKLCFD